MSDIGRCSLCPTNEDGRYCNRPVPPSGPEQCRVLFIGAGPAKTENRTGIVYSGLAGNEMDDTYLPLAGLRRENVAVSNATLCWDGSDRTPGEKRVLACACHHLPALLDRTRPEVVVLMGGVTQRLADTKLRLDIHHGIPQRTSLLGGTWHGWVVPMFEPALGMRDTGQMTHLMADFRRLGQWMRGEWVAPVGTVQETDYAEITMVQEFRNYVDCMNAVVETALDTETHGGEPWSIQISHTPGTGRLIRTNNAPVMHALAEWAQVSSTTWLLHHAPGDLDLCRKFGIELREYRDTMQEAYHLCSLPQGLKALVYRLFGVTMQSWQDVVWPASVDAWVGWCEDALTVAASRPEAVVTELKRGHCADCTHYHSKGVCKCGCPVMKLTRIKVEYKASALEAILKHLHRYTVQTRDDDEPYDPWEELRSKELGGLRGRVADQPTWRWLYEEVGLPPVPGIGNADQQTALKYACLSGNSRVLLGTGEYQSIERLVKSQYKGTVWSSDGQLDRLCKVIGWHRVTYKEPIKWMSVLTDLSRTNRWNTTGTRYTPEHRLLTTNGWHRIDQIRPGDHLVYPKSSLNSVQRQIVIGSILGDGSIQKRNTGGWASLKITHNIRQLPYLKWKQELLHPLSTKLTPIPVTPRKINGRWTTPNDHYSLATLQHPELSRFYDASYPTCGNKFVGDWIHEIDVLGLAVWYQDDGCLVDGQSVRFYTNGFDRASIKRLCTALSTRRIDSRVLEDKRSNTWFIAVPSESSTRLFRIIAPYVHPCISYKLPKRFHDQFQPNPSVKQRGMMTARVESVRYNPFPKERRGSIRTAYCIDVDDTHCFYTMDEVAHNCADADWTLQVGTRLEEERAGRQWVVDEADYDQ